MAHTIPPEFPPEFDPTAGMQPEIGELARRSGRLLQAQFHAQFFGAENLLTKAMRALSAGNTDRAEVLISRAAHMPIDEREGVFPGVRAASSLVYGLISDRLEVADEGDTSWLDVVFEVYDRLDDMGQAEVASVVHGFVLQEWILFELSSTERRRIQKAFGDAPLDLAVLDSPDLTVEQRQDMIRSLILAATALEAAYAASDAQRT